MQPSIIVLADRMERVKRRRRTVILQRLTHVSEFVNADVIAQGLSSFAPENAAVEAGRIMLARLHELAGERANFAFETTLASRTFAPWLRQLIDEGYQFHLFFFWVPSAEFSMRHSRGSGKNGRTLRRSRYNPAALCTRAHKFFRAVCSRLRRNGLCTTTPHRRESG